MKQRVMIEKVEKGLSGGVVRVVRMRAGVHHLMSHIPH